MTIVLTHPSQSTLLTRRAGPAAAKRPSPPCWLARQRDPQREVENLRTFYHQKRSHTESVKRTVANRRKAVMRAQSPPAQPPQPPAEPEPEAQPARPETPLTPPSVMLLGMYASLLDSRLQSVERVSKLLSDWQGHQPLPEPTFPSATFP